VIDQPKLHSRHATTPASWQQRLRQKRPTLFAHKTLRTHHDSAIISAIVVGALGRLFVRGNQNISMVATILIGIVAALAATFIAQALGVGDTSGIDWMKIVIQVALAAVGVSLYAGTRTKTGVRA